MLNLSTEKEYEIHTVHSECLKYVSEDFFLHIKFEFSPAVTEVPSLSTIPKIL